MIKLSINLDEEQSCVWIYRVQYSGPDEVVRSFEDNEGYYGGTISYTTPEAAEMVTTDWKARYPGLETKTERLPVWIL